MDLDNENIKLGFNKASYLCSRREYCSSAIYSKLLQWKLTSEEAQLVIFQLQENKFVDDERYAMAFVRDKSKFSAWGSVKIRMALRTKKISEDIIQMALSDLPDDRFSEQALKEAQKKLRSLKDDDIYVIKQKLARFLFSKGFESSLVWKTVAVVTSTSVEDLGELE